MTSSAYDVIIGGHSYNESNNTSKHYYQILLKNNICKTEYTLMW